MRIAHVLLRDMVGGAESLVTSLSEEFRRLGHETRTVFLDPAGASPSRLARLHRMRAALNNGEFDVVFSHSALPSVFARATSASPVIPVLHSAVDDFDNRTLRYAERVLRRRTAAVIAVSDQQRSAYLSRFGQKVPVRVIPNGIRSDLRYTAGTAARPLRVSTLARVAAQKDPTTWLEVARSLALEDEIELTWYGPDDSNGLLEAESKDLLSAHFNGPARDVPLTLASTDILFHPAIEEAHPIALLEAAASGVPILCTEPVAAILAPFIPTIAFRPRSAEHALSQLRRMRDDLPSRKRAASAVTDQVRQTFGITRCAEAYIELASTLRPRSARSFP